MPNDRPMNRPIRFQQITRLGFTRRPPDEPLTPGLRRQTNSTSAIGFTADLAREIGANLNRKLDKWE